MKPFFQMMPFMNEAVNTFLQKVDRISKTGEIVDFHRSELQRHMT